MVNDFRPFGAAMAKLSTSSKTIDRADDSEIELPLALDKKRRIDPSYELVDKVDELMALCDQLEASFASAQTDRTRLLDALLHEALATFHIVGSY